MKTTTWDEAKRRAEETARPPVTLFVATPSVPPASDASTTRFALGGWPKCGATCP
jgi:hypothetical protein